MTNTGGAPNDVFTALLYSSVGLLSGVFCFIVGIVSPGLIHCCKNVNLEFNPSGVIEWKVGWKNFNLSFRLS